MPVSTKRLDPPLQMTLNCQCGCGRSFTWTRRIAQGPTPRWIIGHRPGTKAARRRRINIERICQHCGSDFKTTKGQIGRGWGLFCSAECLYANRKIRPRTAARKSIRRLAPGESIPSGTPKRYKNAAGYTILRWRVGRCSYVDAFEHRVVAGMPHGKHVHHVNGQKSDNRSENLLSQLPGEHAVLHGELRRSFNRERAAELYVGGMGCKAVARELGINHGTVSRVLRAAGVTMRPSGRKCGHVLVPLGTPTQRESADTVIYQRRTT